MAKRTRMGRASSSIYAIFSMIASGARYQVGTGGIHLTGGGTLLICKYVVRKQYFIEKFVRI